MTGGSHQADDGSAMDSGRSAAMDRLALVTPEFHVSVLSTSLPYRGNDDYKYAVRHVP